MNEKSHSGLPVAGYRPQSEQNISLVNENKILEELCLRQIDKMQVFQPSNNFDQRMVALAKTQLQQAFMWLNRGVFQPGRINLDYEQVEEKILDKLVKGEG